MGKGIGWKYAKQQITQAKTGFEMLEGKKKVFTCQKKWYSITALFKTKKWSVYKPMI